MFTNMVTPKCFLRLWMILSTQCEVIQENKVPLLFHHISLLVRLVKFKNLLGNTFE